jgi:hypothetical protein
MDLIELHTAHTADLDADARAAVRRLPHGGRALRTGSHSRLTLIGRVGTPPKLTGRRTRRRAS